MRRILVLTTALSILAACGSDGPTEPGGNDGGNDGGGNQTPPAQRTVDINGASFSPSNATVAVGGQVTWQDGSGIAHTITPQGHSQWTRVQTTGSGQPLQVTFPTAGTYAYFCEFHSGMSGQITVR